MGTCRPLKKIVDAENDMKMSYIDEDNYFVVKGENFSLKITLVKILESKISHLGVSFETKIKMKIKFYKKGKT